MRFVRSVLLLLIVVAPACVVDQYGNPSLGGPSTSNRCQPGSCFIRSANVCCPNGYLHYAGAGYGCYTNSRDALNASGGKDWYETTCYQ